MHLHKTHAAKKGAKAPVKRRAKAHAKFRAIRAAKNRVKSVLKISQAPVFRHAKKTSGIHAPEIRHSEHAAFRSNAIRAHDAIRSFKKSLSEKHHAIRSKIMHHTDRLFAKKELARHSFAPRAQGHKESISPKKDVMLLNMTKNHLISSRVVFANTTFDKFRGLMFKNKKDVNYALVFDFNKALKDSAAIHMFFVFFPIDVVYLRDSKVVDLHRAVKPFTAYLAPKTHADTLIELPQGTIWKSGISIGDEIVTTK